MQRRLLGGNWKMNCSMEMFDVPHGFPEHHFAGNDVFVAVPFPYLATAKRRFPELMNVGAQDCSQFTSGAYTGEVSAEMILEMGAKWVIVGHSERRRYFELEDISKKIRNACEVGLQVVACVGESIEERSCERHLETVEKQIYALENELSGREVDIAYEPVWAIGTGMTPSEKQIEEIAENIRAHLRDVGCSGRVIYGGSVSSQNCGKILNECGVDGFLVGGASLTGEFCMISEEMKKQGR